MTMLAEFDGHSKRIKKINSKVHTSSVNFHKSWVHSVKGKGHPNIGENAMI
jgi:hypothetical protein